MSNEDLEKVLRLIDNSTAQYFNCGLGIHIEKSNEFVKCLDKISRV